MTVTLAQCWMCSYLPPLSCTVKHGWNSMFHIVWLCGSAVKNPPAMQETQVQSLDQEDSLEKGMVTHSSILAWRIPWREEPGGLQSMGSQRVKHNRAINTFTFFHTHAEEKPVFQMRAHLLKTCTDLSKFCTDSFSYCVAFNRSRILKQTKIEQMLPACLGSGENLRCDHRCECAEGITTLSVPL